MKLASRWKKKKNYSPKRWHNWYFNFNETSGSKDIEYNWAQSGEWRYPKGIVLSPNSRVTGWAQIIMVKGVSLLMPKSVNDTLNTKVQCCGRHQFNPVGSLNEGEKWCEDDKDGGKKWWEARSGWQQEAIDAIKQKFLQVTCHVDLSKENSHWFILVSYLHHHFFIYSIALSSSPPTRLTWCLPVMLNFDVHCFIHWLWCQ